jgi:hypothetical protein
MKIGRDEMLQRLDAFAKGGHGLVAGEPGVGKTYTIAALHDLLKATGREHVLINVESLGSVTDAEVKSVLGIDTDLVAYLHERLPNGKGIVLFDGFDAVRSDAGRERLLSIIRRAVEESKGRWNVLVSVRLFDARRSQGLRDLFRDPSAQKPFKGIGLADARVFEIPRLSDPEVADGVAQISGLSEIVIAATQEFRELLRVPFNLWLVRQILASDPNGKTLSAVASEVQLLGLYWSRRVLSDDISEQAQHVLGKVVREMVSSRALTVRRDKVYEIAAAAAWSYLQSAGVLKEDGSAKQRIGFAHNMLFDYAVSVLAIDDQPDAMAAFIAEDFGRPLFLRPSITYYYTRLWYDAPEAFWKSAWATHSSTVNHVRLVGRLVPPSVIVREARSVTDFQLLLSRIDKGVAEAPDFFLRVLQALSAIGSAQVELWAEVCAQAAGRPRREYAWNVASTASGFWPAPGTELPVELRTSLGHVGRRMLRWALDAAEVKRDAYANAVGALWALPLVARTFASDPESSDLLLRRVLALIEVPGFEIQYFTRLCDTVADLAPVAPNLLADIYVAVFSHKEASDEETHFGSPILPLRSTRRQDFGMCEFALDKNFLAFLNAVPVVAVEAALEAFNDSVIASRIKPYLREGKSVDDLTYVVEFRGRKISVAQDHSSIWLDSAHPEYALKLITQVAHRLVTAAAAGNMQLVNEILDAFSKHGRTQAAWTLLLRAGKDQPKTLGPLLADLALSPVIQKSAYYEVVTFVSATFAEWSLEQQGQFRAQIEGMLGMPEDSEGIEEGLVDRLVMAIPSDLVGSNAINKRRELLITRDAVPDNKPPFSMQVFSRPFTNEDWLEDRGVDTQRPENRKLIDAAARLEEVTKPWQNQRPDGAAADFLAKEMEASLQLLQQLPDESPRDLREMLATRLAATASVIARANDGVAEASLSCARNVLLEFAKHVEQKAEEQGTDAFDTPAWSPSPLTESAQGLPWLITRGDDREVTEAIERLSRSAVPAVRFLTAAELFRIRWNAENAFWRIADAFAATEASSGVLVGLLNSFGSIKNSDAKRIASLLQTISSRRIGVGDERSQFRETYAKLLAWLAFNVEEPWGVETIEAIVEKPLESPELTKLLGFEAMAIVTPEYLRDDRIGPMSRRAFGWTRRLLTGIAKALPLVQEDASGERARALYSVIDEVASRLYFGTRREQQDDSRSLDELRDYLAVVRPAIEDIIEFGTQEGACLLAHTAHHLMELLHACLPLDPGGILHLAADVAVASQSAGYNLDTMAVSEVVEIANALLTDYREAIAEGTGMEDFVRLLDTFANAGWPEALRLLWRVDEVFR